jgi:hypothetical protein
LQRSSCVHPFSQTSPKTIRAARPSRLDGERILAETLHQRGNGLVTKKQFGH